MGDLREDTNGAIGYDFEDKETRSQLELIDDLQKLGVSKYLDLPQLVVVGDQSTGKSSVLQAVTEIPFPTNDSMCTRFATEIVLRRTLPNTQTEIEISLIPDSDETQKRKKELLKWRPDGFSRTGSLDKSSLKSIFQQAEKAIFGSALADKGSLTGKDSSRLSGSTLRITRYGPNETNFAIVDIPGLVRGSETNSEHRTARHLVEKYLKNLRSIVVVVIDVVDLERQEIFQMLNDLPDEESRVIGVINKCDTKQKKSHEWVFDLIRNDPSSSRKYLKEGWYGLRNRQASEMGISDAERDRLEEDFFAGADWRALNDQRLGRHQLKKTLIKMRNKHVKKSIPELLSEIQIKLDQCTAQIAMLGKPRDTNQAKFLLVNKVAAKYSRLADGALDGQYRDLSDDRLFARKLIRDGLDEFNQKMDGQGLRNKFTTAREDAKAIATFEESQWAAKIMEIPTYKWIKNTINRYRGQEDDGDVNPEVRKELWKQQTTSWNEISTDALCRIEKVVAEVNKALLKEACPDEELRLRLEDWLQENSTQASNAARSELQCLITDERDGQLFTLHPLKTERQKRYRAARLDELVRQCRIDFPATGLPQVATPPLSVSHISGDVIIDTLIYGKPDLARVLNTHDGLAAHYDISMHRFVDNFALQVIERHLLGPLAPLRLFTSDYVSQKLYGEENAAKLESLASENPEKAKVRSALEMERLSLEESKKRVIHFKSN